MSSIIILKEQIQGCVIQPFEAQKTFNIDRWNQVINNIWLKIIFWTMQCICTYNTYCTTAKCISFW